MKTPSGKARADDEGSAAIDIEAWLTRADPALGRAIRFVVARLGRLRLERSATPPFPALVRAVVYQQMADEAAAAIFEKLRRSVDGSLTSTKVLALSLEELRAAGLSAAKARYVRNLAAWFDTHRALARRLPSLTNDEIVATLTTIPGIGVWTANVFLIFDLGRPDVVPAVDLGMQRAMQLVYGLPSRPSPAQIRERAERWQPYRSLASRYLWQAVKLGITEADLARRRA